MMILEAEQLHHLFRPDISRAGCTLVEIKIKGNASRPLIQVFIDRDGGVTVDDCSRVSRILAAVLDTHFSEIPQYRLEVSSPGLDRPLRTESDFKKNTGRSVKIHTNEEAGGQWIEGEIVMADSEKVVIRSVDQEFPVFYKHIRIARIQPHL
jgi:ribosome maturation factor RimP